MERAIKYKHNKAITQKMKHFAKHQYKDANVWVADVTLHNSLYIFQYEMSKYLYIWLIIILHLVNGV